MSRDPIGDDVFLKQLIHGRPRAEADKIIQESSRPLYLFLGNDALNRADVTGLTPYDLYTRIRTGHLRKMVGIDFTSSAVGGAGFTGGVQVAFFADTCEIAAFGIGPAGLETGSVFDMPIGLDFSVSFSGSSAFYNGPEPFASAATWVGVFYGGTAGGGPLAEFSIGLFWDPKGYWIGGSIGAGFAWPPVTGKSNPEMFYMIGEPYVLPKCLCNALICKMP